MLRALSNARWAGMGIGKENLKIYRGDTSALVEAVNLLLELPVKAMTVLLEVVSACRVLKSTVEVVKCL